jgi:hypothetical protein
MSIVCGCVVGCGGGGGGGSFSITDRIIVESGDDIGPDVGGIREMDSSIQ